MLSIRFYRIEEGPMDGCDLGHMSISGDRATADSRSPRPQSFMIYISLVDLLSRVAELVQGKSKHYEFVGVGSSFVLRFTRTGEGILVKRWNEALGVVSPEKLYSALFEGVVEFLRGDPGLLDREGSYEQEIRRAWDEFRSVKQSMPTRMV